MATKKTATKTPATKAAVSKTAVAKTAVSKTASKTAAKSAVSKTAAAKTAVAKTATPLKPIKTALGKTGLVAHLAEQTGVEPKSVKAIVAALEAAMFASLHKKGLGEFTMPGLFKVSVLNVPAKKKRTGIDPFTKQERVFAAKPASVKVKVRSLKKLKDAAL